jgi:hypothetical protein
MYNLTVLKFMSYYSLTVWSGNLKPTHANTACVSI